VLLCVGFVAGRITGSGSDGTVTVRETVERSVVVSARHIGSARDPRDSGPLDLARVEAVRRGTELLTTITARTKWRDSLLGQGGVKLSILYDTNDDGRTDQRDKVFLFRGVLTSWISDFGQGVQAADVTRRDASTISVARDVTIFFNRAGEASRLMTSPIGVAVDARWKRGGDRVPDRGWIIVPPPV
jgi:Tfp pilus assembly protein FimT